MIRPLGACTVTWHGPAPIVILVPGQTAGLGGTNGGLPGVPVELLTMNAKFVGAPGGQIGLVVEVVVVVVVVVVVEIGRAHV